MGRASSDQETPGDLKLYSISSASKNSRIFQPVSKRFTRFSNVALAVTELFGKYLMLLVKSLVTWRGLNALSLERAYSFPCIAHHRLGF